MNFNIDINYSLIKDQNHLNNLHKHITRTAKKYDAVRDKIFVYVAKPMNDNLVYNKNIVHVVVQSDSRDFDDIEMTPAILYARNKLERAVSLFIAEYLVGVPNIKEITVVDGMQPDCYDTAPCVHIIYQVEDVNDPFFIADLVMFVNVLDNIVYNM